MARKPLDPFVEAYLVAALWASVDDNGDPIDSGRCISDIADESIKTAIEDCTEFQQFAEDLLGRAGNAEQNGHDFWLTRNGHGVGFWDRGYGEIGEQLTKIAHKFGECYVYIGDDGRVYID